MFPTMTPLSDSVYRDSSPNRSLVVIRFKEEIDAAEFAEAYNGKQFNSMEVCGVLCMSCLPHAHCVSARDMSCCSRPFRGYGRR